MKLDFVKRIGGMGLELALGAFLVGIVIAAWGASESKARPLKGRAAASAAVPTSATLGAQLGTICLQDESNGNFLTFDASGAYSFTSCSLGLTLTGTGVVITKGLVTTLSDIKPDRRITATVDMALRQGKASAQTFSPARTLTIRDKNIDNNTCACQVAPPPPK